MRLPDGPRLNTAPSGVRTKWPSGKRTFLMTHTVWVILFETQTLIHKLWVIIYDWFIQCWSSICGEQWAGKISWQSLSNNPADFIHNERQESLRATGWNIFESSQGSTRVFTFGLYNFFLKFRFRNHKWGSFLKDWTIKFQNRWNFFLHLKFYMLMNW